MVRAGSGQPAGPTTLAGTPATVVSGGTSFKTTLPEAMRQQSPTLILPSTLAPAPIMHVGADLGMAVAGLLAGAAQRHALQERAVVADRPPSRR